METITGKNEKYIALTAYDRYVINWMKENDFSPIDLCEMAQRWAESCFQDRISPKTHPFIDALMGFDHNVWYPRFASGKEYRIWKSYPSFATKEYRDIERMHGLLTPAEFAQYMEHEHCVKIFQHEPTGDASFELNYWSNCVGELHYHGQHALTVDELPEELRSAYENLWTDGYGSLCYLVDTPSGYAVALINEYNCQKEDDFEEEMKPYWIAACKDAAEITKDPCFAQAQVLLGEFTGENDSHELIVLFPATTAPGVFEIAAGRLDQIAFSSLKKEIQNITSECVQPESAPYRKDDAVNDTAAKTEQPDFLFYRLTRVADTDWRPNEYHDPCPEYPDGCRYLDEPRYIPQEGDHLMVMSQYPNHPVVIRPGDEDAFDGIAFDNVPSVEELLKSGAIIPMPMPLAALEYQLRKEIRELEKQIENATTVLLGCKRNLRENKHGILSRTSRQARRDYYKASMEVETLYNLKAKKEIELMQKFTLPMAELADSNYAPEVILSTYHH